MPDTPLAKIIRDEIAHAPISFRKFMELALYHPLHGYYTSGRAQVGRKGDFFTNVSVGPLFGHLIARQFAEIWQHLGRPARFDIIEQGANTGDFAADALAALLGQNPDCFHATRYLIIEPSPILAARQREKLASFPGRVEWIHTESALPPWTGIHFSNELIDAFPIHLVKWTGEQWLERHVQNGPDAFHFIDLPISSSRLAEACAKLPDCLPGTITEINLAARDWIATIARTMQRGSILAIDYGWERDQYHTPTRTTGTLSAYAAHQRQPDPLARPGEIDLTAHVNFTDLADAALQNGLDPAGFTDQHHLIVALGEHHFTESPTPADLRAFKTLMHPQFMGLAFKAIAFTKAIPPTLTAFRYARQKTPA